ncbi:MAG TPA: hypothetical protein VGV41_13845 [Pseudolabrys sp.]|jgi:hypothetical protein|uniref:hypothetical protein n=1 Tax=Pseudolabrys sp. TaxID=1960880 RepID=UPI002DDCAE0A|nr:hypothetical protein [Pseudolabrys sp.]HEV2629714.1 hypothetical protein [Pseudolabrys sp.]
MLSESARATTREEQRFRIDAPNSKARAIKVIALDRASETVLRRLAQQPWRSAAFMTVLNKQPSAQPVGGWLADLAGETMSLIEQIRSADVVVTLSSAGENSEMAGVVAEACRAQGKQMTALILDAAGAPEASLLKTLVPLRPCASMLVVASGEEYVEAMLTALRA